MSALLLAAAAASFVPPSFTAADARQLQQSYPGPQQGGQPAAAVVDAQVDPKGRVSNCKALATSGDGQRAQTICGHLETIQVEPASVMGDRSYGILRDVVSLPPGGSTLANPADMELQVNTLPAGKTTLRVIANVLIDAAGKPQACYAANDAPQAYADVACSQISPITFGTLKDNDGKPVRYVRQVVLDFSTSAPPGQSPSPAG